jgi:hypothetical protein
MITEAASSTPPALGERVDPRRRLSTAVAFLGVAVIVFACFLPVADEGSVTFDRILGNSLRESGIAWLTLALCGLLALTLVRSLRRGERTLGPLIGGLLVMAEAVYIGAAELTTCPVGTDVVDSTACQMASPGIGLFVMEAGGAVLALAGLQLARWREPLRARTLLATEDEPDPVSARLAPYSLHPPGEAAAHQTLEDLYHALRAKDGEVRHEAEYKGYHLYITDTVFATAGRGQEHGFEASGGEWLPFTPDTSPRDLEWILTLVNAAEWRLQRASTQVRA